MKVGFVGAGRMATTMGRHFVKCGGAPYCPFQLEGNGEPLRNRGRTWSPRQRGDQAAGGGL